ncbi:DUF6233 domain-containing protein [Streptomyces chattanoogensis]|uniref:DUF6233 domain-containing protein n=1 Tax=Streptomyces chattanoogensis TaxID=66876 RepID=UPI0036778C3E
MVRPPARRTRPHRRPAPRAEPGVRTVEICVPHPYCRAVPGEDYSSLDPPPSHKRRRWSLTAAPPGDGWVEAHLHRPDCAQAHGGSLLTDREALAALADPDTAAACPICRPDRVLRGARPNS